MSDKIFTVSVDIEALTRGLDVMADSVDAAVRPAAQAGAQVLYEEVQRNVGRLKKHTGKLASSIYQAYARNKSTDGRAVYAVSWNARKAPHGHLVEYGHLQRYEISFDPVTKRFTTHKDRPLASPKLVAARPFVRPAMDKFPAALTAVEDRLFEELAKSGVTS